MDKLAIIGWASGIGGPPGSSGNGPQTIRTSKEMASSMFEWVETISSSSSLPSIEVQTEQMATQLAKYVSQFVAGKQAFAIVGGDHTSAIGTWSGVFDALHTKGEIGLIWIDAHMDSHTPQTSETGNLHGMPLACLLGHGYAPLLKILHATPKLKPENVCLIGVRSYEQGEAAFLKQQKVRVYFMDEVKEKGFPAVFAEAIKLVSKNTCGYGVSLDLDAIDPNDAPGVDVPEPDGIRFESLYNGLAAHIADPKWVATEIVEFAPLADRNEQTKKIVERLLLLLAKAKR